MTRAEYLEFVQEALYFPSSLPDHVAHMDAKPGLYPCDPNFALRDTPEVCQALKMAHHRYCTEVEVVLFPERAEEARAELAGIEMLAQYRERLEATMAVQPITPGTLEAFAK